MTLLVLVCNIVCSYGLRYLFLLKEYHTDYCLKIFMEPRKLTNKRATWWEVDIIDIGNPRRGVNALPLWDIISKSLLWLWCANSPYFLNRNIAMLYSNKGGIYQATFAQTETLPLVKIYFILNLVQIVVSFYSIQITVGPTKIN